MPFLIEELRGEEAQSLGVKRRLRAWELVVCACHVGGNHWNLAIINVTTSEVFVFYLKQSEQWADDTLHRCEQSIVQIVVHSRQRFAAASSLPYEKVEECRKTAERGRVQADSSLCGMFTLAMAWSFMFHQFEHPFAQFHVKLGRNEADNFRLRLLWHSLCAPEIQRVIRPPPSQSAFVEIGEELKAEKAAQ
jgi:hypothetical protein